MRHGSQEKKLHRVPAPPRNPAQTRAGSGGVGPVGAFGARAQGRRELRRHQRQWMRTKRQGSRRNGVRKQHRATAVAGVAVQVGAAQVENGPRRAALRIVG